MLYTFVGPHPESLESGRPIFFGDVIQDDDYATCDERLQRLFAPKVAPAATPTPAPAPAPSAPVTPPTPKTEA